MVAASANDPVDSTELLQRGCHGRCRLVARTRPWTSQCGTPPMLCVTIVRATNRPNRERILIANDNNYPFSDGRWAARNKPDDIEMIVVSVPALR